MGRLPIGVLKDTTNYGLIDNIRSLQSDDYRRRIPNATDVGLKETLAALGNYRHHYNAFTDALVNRIGTVIARNIVWTNPLAEFKRGIMNYGDTIEEVQVGLLQSHTYDPDRDYLEGALFGTEKAHVESSFHTVNRKEFYKITVNDMELRKAFLNDGELSPFISQLMAAPTTSDNFDEFLLTTKLIAEYEHNGGFWHRRVRAPRWGVSTIEGERSAKEALRVIREMVEVIKYPSTKYNAAGMPTFATPDELVLFVTPRFKASIDVEALAMAFNLPYAELAPRIITIPEDRFGIDKAQALLTTRDFFVIYDNVLENTSQYNPVALSNNYFLHHHSVISASRFVPAILFGDFADSEEIKVTVQVTAVGKPTATDSNGATVTKVKPGDVVQLAATVTPANASTDSVRFTVTGAASATTYVTPTGVLHVGRDETATTLSIKGISMDRFTDQPNAEVPPSAALSLTVVGDTVPDWPVVDPVPPAAQGG